MSNRIQPWSQRPWDKNPWEKDTGETYHAHKHKKKKKKHFRLRALMFKRRYIFTDNVHPRKGILSFILSVIAAFALMSCVKAAFDAGADILNDISALEDDVRLAPFCAETKIPVILMHKRGNPSTMQKNTAYDNVFRALKHDCEVPKLQCKTHSEHYYHKQVVDP